MGYLLSETTFTVDYGGGKVRAFVKGVTADVTPEEADHFYVRAHNARYCETLAEVEAGGVNREQVLNEARARLAALESERGQIEGKIEQVRAEIAGVLAQIEADAAESAEKAKAAAEAADRAAKVKAAAEAEEAAKVKAEEDAKAAAAAADDAPEGQAVAGQPVTIEKGPKGLFFAMQDGKRVSKGFKTEAEALDAATQPATPPAP